MWLMFAILAMVFYAATDLIGKRHVDERPDLAPYDLLMSVGLVSLAVGIVFWTCGFGESGRDPWTVLVSEPLLAVSISCYVIYALLCLISLKFLGLSVEAVVGGTNGIVFFIGLIFVHFVFGRFADAQEMLHPARLVPIVIVLTCLFILPHSEKTPASRHRTLIGILVQVLALGFDAADSLMTALVFDRGHVGCVDVMMASWVFAALPILLLSLLGRTVTGRWPVPFRRPSVSVYGALSVCASVMYLFASAHDPVRTGIAFAAAPLFPLVGAHVLLKERYTQLQYLLIGIIATSAIAFCVVDAIL